MCVHYFLNVVILFIVGFILRDGYQYASDWTKWAQQGQSIAQIRENRDTNADILMELLWAGGRGL